MEAEQVCFYVKAYTFLFFHHCLKHLLQILVVCLMLNSSVFLFQGQMTGECVNETKTCQVLAWCPVEDDLVIPEYVTTLNNSY